jgi:EpsI family protein
MTARFLLLSVCFVATAVYSAPAMGPEVLPPRAPLSKVPVRLAQWQGYDEPRFSDEILATLGVDEYLNRTYYSDTDLPVSVYIGYYASQRQGDTIHSPMNCLPGAGWQPVATRRVRLAIPGIETPLDVNHVIIQRGVDRHLVLYWYQSQGRTVASEYWSKFYMVLDAIRTNRSDGALVRVITPMSADRPDDEADRRAAALVRELFPVLDRHLPS